MRSLLLALLLTCVSAGAQEGRAIQDVRNRTSQTVEPRIAEIAESIKMNDAAKKAVDEGWAMLRQGDAETATKLFNKAAGLNSGSAEAYWGLGASTAQQRKFDVANRAFERARALDPDNPRLAADAALAYTYYAMSFPQHSSQRAAGLKDALGRFDEAVRLDSGLSLTYANRAVAFAYKGEYDAAWKDIHKAESIDKTSIDPNLIAFLNEKKPRLATKPADPAPVKPTATIVSVGSPSMSAVPPAAAEANPSATAVQQSLQQLVQQTSVAPLAPEPGNVTAQPPIQMATLQTAQAEPAAAAKLEPKQEPKQEPKSEPKPEQAPANVTEQKSAGEPAPVKQIAPEAEKKLNVIGTPSRYKGPDKRPCLDLPTNEEIIRCVYPR